MTPLPHGVINRHLFAYCPVPGKQRPVAVLQALPGAQSTAVFMQGKAHFWN
jgi:hypothetical protein